MQMSIKRIAMLVLAAVLAISFVLSAVAQTDAQGPGASRSEAIVNQR
jgi:hypothetical protein